MSQAQIDELINKIKDEKLKSYLKSYRRYKNPLDLLGIVAFISFKLPHPSPPPFVHIILS